MERQERAKSNSVFHSATDLVELLKDVSSESDNESCFEESQHSVQTVSSPKPLTEELEEELVETEEPVSHCLRS